MYRLITLLFIAALFQLPLNAKKPTKKGSNISKTTKKSSEKSSPDTSVQLSSQSTPQKNRFKDMGYEELEKAKNARMAEKNYDAALRYFESMKPQCTDLRKLHDLMVEYADLLWTMQDLDKAGKMYQEFVKLYPGSDRNEYASYRAIECNFKQIRDIDRDQSKTIETIELAQQFLERSSVFVTYADQVQEIFIKCQEHLLASDIHVFHFYVHRGQLASAKKRLELIRTTFVPILPKREADILNLEWHFALEQNKSELAATKLAELTQKFPDFAQMEVEKKNTTKFAWRF